MGALSASKSPSALSARAGQEWDGSRSLKDVFFRSSEGCAKLLVEARMAEKNQHRHPPVPVCSPLDFNKKAQKDNGMVAASFLRRDLSAGLVVEKKFDNSSSFGGAKLSTVLDLKTQKENLDCNKL